MKPLKTVEEILDTCIIDGVIPENHAYAVNKAKQELNNHYKELFLSIIGSDEDETQDSWYVAKNELRAELRQKLSEHFNVEGEV